MRRIGVVTLGIRVERHMEADVAAMVSLSGDLLKIAGRTKGKLYGLDAELFQPNRDTASAESPLIGVAPVEVEVEFESDPHEPPPYGPQSLDPPPVAGPRPRKALLDVER